MKRDLPTAHSAIALIIKVTLIIIIIIKLKGDLTTYKKLLNICLVSSDEREFENVMKEQKTAAHAAHLS